MTGRRKRPELFRREKNRAGKTLWQWIFPHLVAGGSWRRDFISRHLNPPSPCFPKRQIHFL